MSATGHGSSGKKPAKRRRQTTNSGCSLADSIFEPSADVNIEAEEESIHDLSESKVVISVFVISILIKEVSMLFNKYCNKSSYYIPMLLFALIT